jgi:integrase
MSNLAWLAEKLSRRRVERDTTHHLTSLIQQPVLMSQRTAREVLLRLRNEQGPQVYLGETSFFKNPEDWIFASPFVAGRMPWYPWGVERRHIIPAGIRCGIGRIGWHTFRHTFRTLLDETGAPMKVQQELMRHADIRTTMNVYGKAMDESKRKAHGKVVRLVLPLKVA